ncbi:flagellar hook assembly protein FlgD [Sphingomonas sp.]|uniref:flagellar hook assembly protein FlgD n=1 Tax=Sphingomonas sp. TaxID=28214 RepID=UPI003CC59846
MTASAFDSTLAGLGISRATTGVTVSPASSSGTTLGQADFLKLMTAQMQNQDPFNPTDNTQMVAQMAQFSSLAGISEMSTTLKSIATKLGATSATDAMAYIGKTVLTPGDTAYGRTTGGVAGAVELGAAATDVTVTISNANGQILNSQSLGAHAAGTVSYDWDGKDATGADAGPGPFTVSVNARDGASTVAATNLVWAPVESVSTSSGAAVLTLPGIGQVPVTAVRQIG